jgi:hypothetical protein
VIIYFHLIYSSIDIVEEEQAVPHLHEVNKNIRLPFLQGLVKVGPKSK